RAVADLFGGGAEHRHAQAEVVGGLGQRDARSGRHRGNHIVPAGVADRGQTVVLGADRDMQRARAGARHEGGRQLTDSALDREAGAVEGLAQPSTRALLFETELGMGVDAVAEVNQCLAMPFQCLARYVLGVHAVPPLSLDANRTLMAAGASGLWIAIRNA